MAATKKTAAKPAVKPAAKPAAGDKLPDGVTDITVIAGEAHVTTDPEGKYQGAHLRCHPDYVSASLAEYLSQ